MQLTNTLFGLSAIAAAAVNAQGGATIKVTVGKDGVLEYNPNSLVAEVGTAIEFDFFPKNHSVTQSSFADPCHPLAGGFFSSFVPTKESPSGSIFTITVNDTKPIWFYCGQTTGNHCQAGMVGAINAPASGNTFDKFAALAKNATTSTSPPLGPVGGILKVSSTSTSTSTSTSSSSSSSAYTTKAYTSTYTSDSAVHTVTATTTLFTVAPPSTTASSGSGTSRAAAPTTNAASGLKAFNAGAMILAAAAIYF
ncbi:putative GPI-anchored cupredoxin [Hyphodiscus hymeniophilus]|uniref:GPI-anchored cupredoxin n=1 Tax=Hyphodiscus hymeniophilus TaxID=353542 RepID=A0A9P7AVS2_9HELO|nr:putative GPI-anchored cupredoxin [Hyphodiscus hymeniophilus]